MSCIPQGHRPRCQPFEPMQLTLLTWKYCLDVFAPAMLFCQLMFSNGQISWYKSHKIPNFPSTTGVLRRFLCRGSAPDPAGRTHDAPPDPLVGWGGGYPLPIPHSPRRIRRLDLGVPNFISRKLATLPLAVLVGPIIIGLKGPTVTQDLLFPLWRWPYGYGP